MFFESAVRAQLRSETSIGPRPGGKVCLIGECASERRLAGAGAAISLPGAA